MKRRTRKRLRCLTKRQLRNRKLENLLFYSFLQRDASSYSSTSEDPSSSSSTCEDSSSDSSTSDDSSSDVEDQAPVNNLNFNNEPMNTDENRPPSFNMEDSVPEYVNIDEMETDNNPSDAESLPQFLKNWAFEYCLTHAQLRPLLAKLKEHECFSKFIPKDPRTLLGTPTGKTAVKNLSPGVYHHFGLKDGITKILNKYADQPVEEIHLKIGIDGVPISKSSGAQFYPILGSIEPFPDVFLIGVYFGHAKPNSAEDFLDEFLEETEDVCLNGLKLEEKVFNCRIKCIIADAPAKAFILSIKHHSGYYSCLKCTIKGKYKRNRVCFPYKGKRFKRRTDAAIRNFKSKKHQLGRCCLRRIPNFDLVKCIPYDYMHLICLGCTKTLLCLYKVIRTKRRLKRWEIEKISRRLCYLRKYSPQEFQRKPRGLKELKYWKATEFRQFLLYTGSMVLRRILSPKLLRHFNTLHVAMRILCSDFLSSDEDYLDYADKLLYHFVESLAVLFGEEFVSYNFHALLHLVEDVKVFGKLDNFSAFNFENFMQYLKKWMRKGEKPLQQLVRRYKEFSTIVTEKTENKWPKNAYPTAEHCQGPLLDDCQSPQYEKVILKGFVMDTTKVGDQCFGLNTGEIVMVHNVAHSVESNKLVIVAKKFRTMRDLYKIPLPSSEVGEYIVKDLSDLKTFALEDVVQKYLIVPSGNQEYIVSLLLHGM